MERVYDEGVEKLALRLRSIVRPLAVPTAKRLVEVGPVAQAKVLSMISTVQMPLDQRRTLTAGKSETTALVLYALVEGSKS